MTSGDMVMMEKFSVIVMFVVVVVVVEVNAREQRHHPKFRSLDTSKQEVCNREHEISRDKMIEEARCGEPKNVFVDLPPTAAHQQLTPGAVWVKRCVGFCPETESNCVPLQTRIIKIPVRVIDVKANKGSCNYFDIEEHVSCGCCATSGTGCPGRRVFNPRKCSCQCPNLKERRLCKRKWAEGMRWNRSSCKCESIK